MNRVAVVGTSGSGKSTFNDRLASRLDLPRIELDALHWEPGWVSADADVFRARVEAAVAADAWVLDGNYSAVRDLYLGRLDTVVWLDLPLRTCLWRIVVRSFRRARTGEDLWETGNRESLRKHLGRDSLVWWVLTTHRRRRRQYAAQFADLELEGVDVHRFSSSGEAQVWLSSVPLG